jgi:hypothetical protein
VAIDNDDAKNLAYRVALEAFYKYFSTRTDVTTSHILLSVLFPEESSIRSVMGGLETSLGTRLWENLARLIAEKNDFQILNPKTELVRPTSLPREITNFIAKWRELRETELRSPTMDDFKAALSPLVNRLAVPTNFQTLNKGSGADIFLKKGDQEWAFDIKTVQINAGSGPKLNGTLMEWIAYRALAKARGSEMLNAHIVIPYDPTGGNWWHAFSGRISPLDNADVYVADNFWDFIGGTSGVLDAVRSGFAELNLVHGVMLRKALLGMSDEVHLELLAAARSIRPKDSELDWKRGNKSWVCTACGSTFTSTYKKINEQKTHCPSLCVEPINLVVS